jgi:hypothetical protein
MNAKIQEHLKKRLLSDVVVIGDENVLRDLHYDCKDFPRKRLIVGPGAAKRGHALAMRMLGLERSGIPAERFAKGLFTSSASWVGVAYAARQSHLVSEFFKKMTWLHPAAFWAAVGGDQILLDWLKHEVLRVLDYNEVVRCAMDIDIALADLQGGVQLRRVKDTRDALELCEIMAASSALFPKRYGKEINGVFCADGGFTIRSSVLGWLHRVLRGMEKGREIDLLYVASHPHHDDYLGLIERFLYNLFTLFALWDYPELARGARTVDAKFRKMTDLAERTHVGGMRVCVIAPQSDEYIIPNEWRPRRLEATGTLTLARTEKLFKSLKPGREV